MMVSIFDENGELAMNIPPENGFES